MARGEWSPYGGTAPGRGGTAVQHAITYHFDMSIPPLLSPRFTRALHHLGRALVLAAQLVVMLAPLDEVHEARAMAAHVEAPRTTPHPGYQADSCPACILLSVQAFPSERPRLAPIPHRAGARPGSVPSYAHAAARAISNSSRAPPLV